MNFRANGPGWFVGTITVLSFGLLGFWLGYLLVTWIISH